MILNDEGKETRSYKKPVFKSVRAIISNKLRDFRKGGNLKKRENLLNLEKKMRQRKEMRERMELTLKKNNQSARGVKKLDSGQLSFKGNKSISIALKSKFKLSSMKINVFRNHSEQNS